MVKKYEVQLYLTDNHNFTLYTFKLEITNGPPYWKTKKPVNQKVRLNEVKEFMIPEYMDDENNPVMVIQSLPSFIIFDNGKYTLKPTVPNSDIGWFIIKGQLSDSKAATDFSFSVNVFNEPPYFKQGLKDQKVKIGLKGTYELPMTEDKELLTVKTKV